MEVLQLIAFTDRNPADHKAIGINSIALHGTARPAHTQTEEDCITHGLKSGQAYSPISTAQTRSICTHIEAGISFSKKLLNRLFRQTQTCNLSQHLIDTHTHTHRLCFCLVILDLSLQVALHPSSEQTDQRFAPLPPCHRGQVQTLCGPPAC